MVSDPEIDRIADQFVIEYDPEGDYRVGSVESLNKGYECNLHRTLGALVALSLSRVGVVGPTRARGNVMAHFHTPCRSVLA